MFPSRENFTACILPDLRKSETSANGDNLFVSPENTCNTDRFCQ